MKPSMLRAFSPTVWQFRVLLLTIPFITQFAAAAEPESRSATAERFFKPLIEREWAHGLVVGIVDEQGEHVKGFGHTGNASTAAPDGDTLFEIGSISKVFTAILLSDMIERGELSLDDPVNKLLPDDIGELRCA